MSQNGEDLLKLFKYRSLDGDFGRVAVADAILRNRLFWQSPTAFNDPFDCSPVFIFGESDVARRAFMSRAMRNNRGATNRYQRRRNKRVAASKPKAWAESHLKAGFDQWMAETAITCFSLVENSALMWAHYANDHRGICLGFREALGAIPFVSHRVEYVAARPIVDLTKFDRGENAEATFLRKAECWSYEQEMRMVEYRRMPGFRIFPQSSLISVTMGARISSDDRTFVEDLIKERSSPVELFQCELDPRDYRLVSERVL